MWWGLCDGNGGPRYKDLYAMIWSNLEITLHYRHYFMQTLTIKKALF
jgi:hypothetical protein